MRKYLLACSLLATAGSAVLLGLAAIDVSRGAALPLGALLGFLGVNSLLAVLLLGQRTVMERTSAMMTGRPVQRGAPAPAPSDQVQQAIEESMQTLAWSIDARLVGLLEYLIPDSREDTEKPSP